jgi:hypothetical protein
MIHKKSRDALAEFQNMHFTKSFLQVRNIWALFINSPDDYFEVDNFDQKVCCLYFKTGKYLIVPRIRVRVQVFATLDIKINFVLPQLVAYLE